MTLYIFSILKKSQEGKEETMFFKSNLTVELKLPRWKILGFKSSLECDGHDSIIISLKQIVTGLDTNSTK